VIVAQNVYAINAAANRPKSLPQFFLGLSGKRRLMFPGNILSGKSKISVAFVVLLFINILFSRRPVLHHCGEIERPSALSLTRSE